MLGKVGNQSTNVANIHISDNILRVKLQLSDYLKVVNFFWKFQTWRSEKFNVFLRI